MLQSQQPVQITTKSNALDGAIRPADAAGRYSLLREGGKDTGCMLTLDDEAKGRVGKALNTCGGLRSRIGLASRT